MDQYLLTLLVSMEQENAIRELYINKRWLFYKCDPKDSSITLRKDVYPKETGQVSIQPTQIKDSVDEEMVASKLVLKTHVVGALTGDFDATDLTNINEENGIYQMQGMEYNYLEMDREKREFEEQYRDVLQSDTIVNTALQTTKTDSGSNSKSHFNETSQTTDKSFVEDNLESETKLDSSLGRLTRCKRLIVNRPVEAGHNSEHTSSVACKEDSDKNSQTVKRIRRKRNQSNRQNQFEKNANLTGTKQNVIGKKSNQKTKVGSFPCNECGVTFKLLGSFNHHKRDGKCMFTCEFCGKIFTSRYYYNYQIHLKYHKKERAHQCDICGKSYIETNALKIHKRTHSNDRPFVCDLCGQCFYSSSHLIYHKKSLHSETHEIHQCDLCGAVLSTLGNLRVHKQTVHVEDRPFTCEICGKAFKTKKALEQKHALVHENVFPYKCEVNGCGKSFKTSASLQCHVRRHNNQRSHFCPKCGKGFYNKKDLNLHSRVHTGEKPYSCKLCEYSCSLAGNLRKHMKTHDR